jgi:ribonuclease D
VARPDITLHRGDLPATLSFGDAVAIDTESLGLNWTRDRLCLVQLSAGDGKVHLVQFARGQYAAPNLKKLLADPSVTKIFHFARADLATLAHHLGVMPKPVYCTKIASALARTFTEKHSLKDLVKELLGLELAKEQQCSDWGADDLTSDQKFYAANDVLYLHKLRAKLDMMLQREDRAYLAEAAFAFLPARAALDLAGWADVDIFAHRPVANK